jgi:hypothetical protein
VKTLVLAKENKLAGEFSSMANFVDVQKHSVSFGSGTTKLVPHRDDDKGGEEEEKEEGLTTKDNNDKACR